MSKPLNPKTSQFIEIKGARSNNLRNVDALLPKSKLIVVTGVSGSGKSSLIIDTLYAEGQRRYVESLSAYARQFLTRMKKPELDYIKGLCPAIAIEQKVTSSNARSTVGSLTEIYDFLRLLYARLGKTYSPVSGKVVKKHEVKDVVDFIVQQETDTKIYISFNLQQNYPDRSLQQELEILLQKGFNRIFWNHELQLIEDLLVSKKNIKHKVTHSDYKSFFIVVDRLKLAAMDEDMQKRIADSILTCFSESLGDCTLILNDEKILHFSSRFELDGIKFPEPSPQLFNYNNSFGACPVCEGYGRIIGIDENKVVPNKSKTVYEGAIACWSGEKSSEWLTPLIQIAAKIKFPLHVPYRDLSDAQKEILWNGIEQFQGIYAFFKDLEEKLYKIQNRIMLARYRGKTHCTACKGARLRKEALYVKFAEKNFRDLMFIPIEDLLKFFKTLKLDPGDFEIAKRLLLEITNRLEVLDKIGLSYLTLDRLSSTLSGGESQRIHLTRTLGSNLTSSLYILDEPSIGLHPKDTAKLVEALHHLRDLGNTVIVIEHEEEIIKNADEILDIGPGAGIHGGTVVYSGSYKEFLNQKTKNLTASYITGINKIPIPLVRKTNSDQIVLEDINLHNLQNLKVHFPLQCMICVSGVSGSGKTSLIKHVFHPLLQAKLTDEFQADQNLGTLSGAYKRIKQVELVNQQAIGRSSRSNPATYVKAYDEIRDIFKQQPLSKLRHYQPKHFSFNVEGGRCETCKGDGEIIVEMQFLADVSLICEDCNGKRFSNEILEVKYKDKNIFNILEMSIEEALQFFSDRKELVKKLKPLNDVGLGYLKLGQSSSTLSGGEAQRLKLAYYLGLESSSDHIFFIFDEPTTGLHFDDVKKLLFALHSLVEKGHTVLVIEHNMDVLKTADWIIDLGPGGGRHGGQLLYEGNPEGLLKVKNSHTAYYLKEKLKV
ncbi:MAG: excinuclease ABC subunit UvrA [Saprospiraceae bacterium]|nr:excinuclease ABC subunit UvrA [Saprospiraceae bacterium]MBK7738616.1 excinuclease ABC subunit UvrA [Saprospiraceae bacterium]MBK7912812.1 excinuclease ABC subunit UvrA [Saprospiraceae bacterium]